MGHTHNYAHFLLENWKTSKKCPQRMRKEELGVWKVTKENTKSKVKIFQQNYGYALK